MTTDTKARGIGDNLADLSTQLEAEYEGLLTEAEAMIAEFGKVPAQIDNAEHYDIALRVQKTARDLLKRADDTRARVKEPFLKAGRDVDGFFNGRLRDKLTSPTEKLRRDIGAYLLRVEEARREDERKKADQARADADAAAARAAEAEQGGQVRVADANLESAVQAEQTAIKHEKRAELSTTDMSRTASDAGTGSIRKVWRHKNVDRNALDLESLRPFFPDDALDAAIKSFIKAGRRELKGVTIFEDVVTTVR